MVPQTNVNKVLEEVCLFENYKINACFSYYFYYCFSIGIHTIISTDFNTKISLQYFLLLELYLKSINVVFLISSPL